jgi:chemotaxis protein CheX
MKSNATDHESWRSVLELASQEVFDTMLASPLTLAPEPDSDDRLDITAMVGLAGMLCGVLTIRCNSKAGTAMASKMLGISLEEAASQICDAMGEICNMVAGNFKNKVSGMGDGCMLSVPTVITGGDYDCHSLAESNALKLSFLFERENVLIALQVQS